MSKCNYCNQEMDKEGDSGCILKTIEIEGETRPRIPYIKPYLPEQYNHCHDCGVTEFRYHHPGCDMERCINCDGQLISCQCEITDLKGVKIPKQVLEELARRSTGKCACCNDDLDDNRKLHNKNEELVQRKVLRCPSCNSEKVLLIERYSATGILFALDPNTEEVIGSQPENAEFIGDHYQCDGCNKWFQLDKNGKMIVYKKKNRDK